VHPEKSVFGAAVVSYLGYAVSESGLTPQEAKIKAVKEMKAQLHQSELRTVFVVFSVTIGVMCLTSVVL
jgi:hypothetical protein